MNDSLSHEWNATDASPRGEAPTHAQKPTPPRGGAVSYVVIEPNHISLRLAALSGIGLVLASAATFYLGVEYLRGSILDTQTEIHVTADGVFAPSSITIEAGSSLLVTNDNADPQVIKHRQDGSVFEPVVLFPGESKTVDVIEATPVGTYVFGSETLPETSILTVEVTAKAPQSASNVPIPSLVDLAPEVRPAASSVSSTTFSSSSIATLFPPTTLSSIGGATFTLGAQSSSASSVNLQGNLVPVNPYTVGNTRITAPPQTLHSGAPLKNLPRARTQPSTGTGTWMFGAFALIAMISASVIPLKLRQH